MPLYVKIFAAATPEALVAAANAFLATLSSPTIRKISLASEVQSRRSGGFYQMAISYEVPGQTTLRDPWVLRIDKGATPEAARASLEAFMALSPSAFFNGSQIRLSPTTGPHVDQCTLITLYCADSAALYNYSEVPLVSSTTTSTTSTTSTTTTPPPPGASSDIGFVVTQGLGYQTSGLHEGFFGAELHFQLLASTPGETVTLEFSGVPKGPPQEIESLSGPAFVDNGNGTFTATFITGSETVQCRLWWPNVNFEEVTGTVGYSAVLTPYAPVTGSFPISTVQPPI